MSGYQNCPYFRGAEFSFKLSPGPSAKAHTSIKVRVLKLFAFEESQTMMVEVLCKTNARLPKIAFLKLYDRRFLEVRKPGSPSRMRQFCDEEWNAEKEARYTEIQQQILAREDSERMLTELFKYMRYLHDYYEVEPEIRPGTGKYYTNQLRRLGNSDSVTQWRQENSYEVRMNMAFERDCGAYSKLESLQGSYLPKFIGAVTFEEPLSIDVLPSVRGILLELIDGIPVADVTPEDPLVISRAHLDAVDELHLLTPKLGVIKWSQHPEDIWITRDGKRVVALNWADAFIQDRVMERSDGETQWQTWTQVEEREGTTSLKMAMTDRGLIKLRRGMLNGWDKDYEFFTHEEYKILRESEESSP
jgi:hypothetical protein